MSVKYGPKVSHNWRDLIWFVAKTYKSGSEFLEVTLELCRLIGAEHYNYERQSYNPLLNHLVDKEGASEAVLKETREKIATRCGGYGWGSVKTEIDKATREVGKKDHALPG